MKGSYVLLLDLERDARLTIGRLGTFEFPAGHYLYFGSALNGLEGRVRRHLRRDKKLHWHVDYFTMEAEIREVWWVAGEGRRECRWAEVALEKGGKIVVPGFGSSDCRCTTHLFRLKRGNNPDSIRKALPTGGAPARREICPVGNSERPPPFQMREPV